MLFTVAMQILLTIVITTIASMSHFLTSVSVHMVTLFIAGMVGINFSFMCFQHQFRKYPINYIVLLAYTFCQSMVLNVVLMQYTNGVIARAVLLTGVVVSSLGIFAYRTKIDIMSTKAFSYLMMTQFFAFILGAVFFGF